MSESGLLSESGESGSESEVDSCTDNSDRWSHSEYSYSEDEEGEGESSSGGEESEREYLAVTGLGAGVGTRDESDWQYCEQAQPQTAASLDQKDPQWQRKTAGAMYRASPERGPPILDFMFVLTAFFAACMAAYYTIFTEDLS